ncbi:MAG TPA: DMT family transporter [Rhizobiaceae bacterium]|nr:DMT family transporter [Rhizobiaceae bacterium]
MNSSPHNTDTATPLAAILLIIGAGFFFACLDTGAKYLVLSGMSALFVAWVRFATHLVLVLLLFRGWDNRAMYTAKNLPAQVLRGVFLVATTAFNFMALRTLQLAETMSFFFFAPMVITALAGPLLGEWAGWRRWLAVIAGFAGVLVITRPGVSAFELGHVYALVSMLSYVFYVIMTRQMGVRETAESMIFYSALAPTILMAPVALYTASLPVEPWHWAILLSLGFFGGFGHWLIIRAYKLATTSALAPYPYLQMVWMIVSGYVIFDQFPDNWTLAGAAIIVASGLYIVRREHLLRLKSRSAPNTEDQELAKKL